MLPNIKEIKLGEPSRSTKFPTPPVKIIFRFPCSWTILDIESLKKIIRLWIKGEEMAYPRPAYSGRWKLFKELMKEFMDDSDSSHVQTT